jgi:transposase
MQRNDLSRSLVAFEQDSTLVAVVELSLKSWLVAGLVPGLERQPLKRLGADQEALVALLHRWRSEALKAGQRIERLVVAFEAGRDGFWLARFLRARGIEAYVIHATSIPVPREHRRAKTDRLDTALLMRAFLGWLRGERGHCSMAAIPSLAEEDAKRPSREHEKLGAERSRITNKMKAALVRLGISGFKAQLRTAGERLAELRTPEGEPIPPNTLAELRRDLARLALITEQIKEIESARQQRLKRAPQAGTHPMMLLLARLKGLGIETADTLVHEALYRGLRDRRALARYAGLSGAPDESGSRRREKGLPRAGNARVRKGMLQLAWRWLMFQKESALTRWFRERTAAAKSDVRKTMIIALARKLLIALAHYVTNGEPPAGAVLWPTK